MRRHAHARTLIALGLALATAGCQRGCLSTWLREHGVSGEPPSSPLAPASEPTCPAGMARCVGGVVLASRELRIDGKCSPEGCHCPWDEAGKCTAGCVTDGLSVEMPKETAARQLCAPDPGAPRTGRILGPGDVVDASLVAGEGGMVDDEPLCDIERFRCVQGVVYSCDGGPKAVARCGAGCAPGEGSVFEPMAVEAAVAILCAR